MSTTDIFLAMSYDGFKINGSQDYGTGDVRCPKAIEVLEYSHSVKQHGSETGGRPRSVEYVEHGDFEIKKAVDASSPELFRMCCGAAYIAEAKILLYSAGGGWSSSAYPAPFLVYTLSYVHVSYVESSGGGGIPTEKIGLKYGQMKVHQIVKNLEREWSQVLEAPVHAFSGVSGAGDYKTSP